MNDPNDLMTRAKYVIPAPADPATSMNDIDYMLSTIAPLVPSPRQCASSKATGIAADAAPIPLGADVGPPPAAVGAPPAAGGVVDLAEELGKLINAASVAVSMIRGSPWHGHLRWETDKLQRAAEAARIALVAELTARKLKEIEDSESAAPCATAKMDAFPVGALVWHHTPYFSEEWTAAVVIERPKTFMAVVRYEDDSLLNRRVHARIRDLKPRDQSAALRAKGGGG